MKPAEVRRGLSYENALGQQVVVETIIGDKARVRISSGDARPVKIVKPLDEIAAEFNRSRRLPPGLTAITDNLLRRIDEDGTGVFGLSFLDQAGVRRAGAQAIVYPTGELSFGATFAEGMDAEAFSTFFSALGEMRALAHAYADRLKAGQP